MTIEEPTNHALNVFSVEDANLADLQAMNEHIVSNPDFIIPDPFYSLLVRLIDTNLFRVLPPPRNVDVSQALDPDFEEEDASTLDPPSVLISPYQQVGRLRDHNPLIQLIYELFIHVLESPSFKPSTAKDVIDRRFVLQLMELFDSADPNERESLKTALHRLYWKCLYARSFVRKQLSNIFCSFVYDQQRHNGIATLLEVLVSIINGFAVPLREEHRTFLLRVLLPLHKSRSLNDYQTELTCCIVQFVEKEASLTEHVIRGLLRLWPTAHSLNEVDRFHLVLLLRELEVVLDNTDSTEFRKVMVPLFQRLAKCVLSPHLQVAERALYFWTNDDVRSLVRENAAEIFPIMLPVFQKNLATQTIRNLVNAALNQFMEMNHKLFKMYSENTVMEPELLRTKEKEREQRWERIEWLARRNPQYYNLMQTLRPETGDIMPSSSKVNTRP